MPTGVGELAAQAEQAGHVVATASLGIDARPIVVCLRCGCYGTIRAVGLGKPCAGRLSGQRRRLLRMKAGWHPHADRPIGAIFRLVLPR